MSRDTMAHSGCCSSSASRIAEPTKPVPPVTRALEIDIIDAHDMCGVERTDDSKK